MSGEKSTHGQYLPYRLEATTGSTSSGFEQYYFRFFWKVGDEIGDEVFQWESTDFRLPFSKYFSDFKFDTPGPEGFVPGSGWEAPEDLYEQPYTVK